ncbi:calcium-binding protein [Pseudomonas fortuita]|uniref:calcium-binding protein n=1 Tax=Pseudomonas fortuita TaxID=3233375 RepID=UPI003C2B968C
MSSVVDTIAPKLTSLKIPTLIDLSSGMTGLTVTGMASDDNSGIKNVLIRFDRTLTYSHSLNGKPTEQYSFLLNSGITDSWSDGYSSQTWAIADTNPSGSYNITEVLVSDFQGNTSSYSASELSKMGINTSISFINSTPDTTPPQLKSLIIPKKVDLSSGTGELTISGTASDNYSGIKNVQIIFDKDLVYSHSLNGSPTQKYNFLLNPGISDSWSDGSSSQTWAIAGSNQSGTYNITEVLITDFQGNTKSYLASDLARIGVNTSIDLVNSAGDSTPPQLKSLNIPTVVDLSPGMGELTISGTASDDNSGIKHIQILFDKTLSYSHSLDGSPTQQYNYLLNPGISDSWADGASAQTWGIAGTNASGIYKITGIVIQDFQGNTRSYSPGELADLGVNTTILMVSSKSVLTSGDDSFIGGRFSDWIVGGDGKDVIKGMAGDDLLDGGNGDDILDGGSGADTMIGGLGNDTYYVDWFNDKVIETSANGGIDTVISSISRTLGDFQENLILTGTASIYGSGNNLDNTLTGNDGNNVLNGGAGSDTMIGGLGNDTYYVDWFSDKVIETSANGGIDTIISSINRTLGDYQENLILTGTASIYGNGNGLANVLTGNSGNNVLNGGSGNDTISGGGGNDRLIGGLGKDVLTGGAGKDVFVYNSTVESGLTMSNRDVISDFQRGSDKIDLSKLDANTATIANDAFHTIFNGAANFTAAGQLKFDGGILYGNTNSDSNPEFAIQITGVTSMALSDFVL